MKNRFLKRVVDEAKFSRLWNSCDSIDEVREKSGLSLRALASLKAKCKNSKFKRMDKKISVYRSIAYYAKIKYGK